MYLDMVTVKQISTGIQHWTVLMFNPDFFQGGGHFSSGKYAGSKITCYALAKLNHFDI